MLSWRLVLKATAFYRDGSKLSQLSASGQAARAQEVDSLGVNVVDLAQEFEFWHGHSPLAALEKRDMNEIPNFTRLTARVENFHALL